MCPFCDPAQNPDPDSRRQAELWAHSDLSDVDTVQALEVCLKPAPGDHTADNLAAPGRCFYPPKNSAPDFPGQFLASQWRQDIHAMQLEESDLVQDAPWLLDGPGGVCDKGKHDSRLTHQDYYANIFREKETFLDHLPADGSLVCVLQSTLRLWAADKTLASVFNQHGTDPAVAKPTVYVAMRDDPSLINEPADPRHDTEGMHINFASWTEVLRSSTIQALWSMNLFNYHPKLHALPIGVRSDYLQEVVAIRSKEPKPLKCLAFVGFNADNPVRKQVLELVTQNWTSFVHVMSTSYLSKHCPENNRSVHGHRHRSNSRVSGTENDPDRMNYLSVLGQCAFTISAPGNGWDCYRTWEALYMGSIPILLRSQTPSLQNARSEPIMSNIPLVPSPAGHRDSGNRAMAPVDHIYSDLPVLFVDDYAELSESMLRQAYTAMAKKTYNLEKLRSSWWRSEIERSLRESPA
jgi:hypothetical protein